MKKFIAVLVAVVLVCSLAGCGGAASSVSSVSESSIVSSILESSSIASSESSSEAAKQAEEEKLLNNLIFNFTADDFISVMDQRLKGNNYPTIADSPYENIEQEIEGIGAANCRSYMLATGFNLLLYETKEDKKLFQIMCTIEPEMDAAGAELWGYFRTTLLFKIDPDDYKAVGNELDLSDTTDGKITSATGNIATYMHMISGKTEMLIVYPKTEQ